MALAIVLAFPAGVQLRAQVDDSPSGHPTHTPASSDLVDADPDEADLNRFVVTTDAPARRVTRRRGVVEAIDLGGGQVAIATTRTRQEVAALDGVTRVERDALRWVTSGDPAFRDLWALQNTGQTIYGTPGVAGADIRWNDVRGHADGTGAVVAVIDSGIDFSHPDLAHAVWTNPDEICANGRDDDGNGFSDDCHGWDFVNNDNQQFDLTRADGSAVDNYHGTHIAGTIAAAADNGIGIAGVAPGAKIMPLKVVENGSFPMSRTALAINYAVANGADVINASWGGPGMGTAELNAVKNAEAKGVLVVAAAGNSGSNNDVTPHYPASVDGPGVIAVAASTNQDANASFSCYGKASVDLHAPGQLIVSTAPGGGLVYMSGTSMAAPHVTAVVGLLRSRTPGMPLAEVRKAILSSVDRLDALAGKTATGGRLDAASALSIGEGGTIVDFNSFDEFTRGEEHTAEVVLRAAENVLPAAVTVNATLGVVDGGGVRGVLEHPINDAVTDRNAQVELAALSGADMVNLTLNGVSVPVTTTLPAGDYALLIELVNDADPQRAVVGQPSVVLFSIAGPDQPAPEPSDGATPPAGSDPGTGQPGPGTTSPDPGGGDPAPNDPAPSPPPGDSAPAPIGPSPEEPVPGPGGGGPAPDDPAPQQPAPPPPPPGEGPTPDDPATSPVTGADPAPDEPGSVPPPADGDPEDPYVPIAPPPYVPPPTVPGHDDPTQEPVGHWRVSPSAGPTSGGQYVHIEIGFHEWADVHFDDTSGTVVYHDAQWITVKTPAQDAGVVDITILGHAGATVVLPRAYTFVSEDQATAPPGTQPVPDPIDPGTQPPPDSTPPPDTPPGTIAPPDAEDPTSPGWRTVGLPYTTVTGLKVDSFVAGHPLGRLSPGLWTDHACRQATCRGIPL